MRSGTAAPGPVLPLTGLSGHRKVTFGETTFPLRPCVTASLPPHTTSLSICSSLQHSFFLPKILLRGLGSSVLPGGGTRTQMVLTNSILPLVLPIWWGVISIG